MDPEHSAATLDLLRQASALLQAGDHAEAAAQLRRALVRADWIDVPDGWSSFSAYLSDLVGR